MSQLELTVVIPVYNEGTGLKDMLEAWSAELDRLSVSYVLRVFDDGSNDDTPRVLGKIASQIPKLEVVEQQNKGHGPTILRGYREAMSEWILQVDGDDEIGPGEFAGMWSRRTDYDLLMGVRKGRDTRLVRRVVTWCARWVVRVGFKARFQDVNTPYRLMKKCSFNPLFDVVPLDSFAPNVALTGMAAALGLRIVEMPVRCGGSSDGRSSSLRSLRLCRGVVRSLWQTTSIAVRLRRQRHTDWISRGGE